MSILVAPVSTMTSFAPKIPEGPHSARLISIVDLGTQPNYDPKKAPVKKLKLTFEFMEVRKTFKEGEPEKPAIRGVSVTKVHGEGSNLYKILSACNGANLPLDQPMDPSSYLGKALTIDVSHALSKKGNKYIKFESYTKIPRKPGTDQFRYDVPEAENPHMVYSIADHPHNWDALMEWDQAEIAESPEYKKKVGQPVIHADVEEHDDVSF